MRYLPLSDTDRASMLETIGVKSIDDLFVDVPAPARRDDPVDLPAYAGEMEVEAQLNAFAAENLSPSKAPFFIGAGAYVQGRFDGTCVIGDHVWIGPGAYFDARDLVLGEHVGWGPGAKVLGSQHTGIPADIPIVGTDLEIRPVRIEAWADIGTNAVILPGVTIGRGAIVGAGAVVTADVEPFAVVAGVPARFLHWREGSEAMRGPAPKES